MLNGIRIEICAGSLTDVRIASSFKEVDRIELNSHLEEDGLTPEADVFRQARKESDKEILPMVRLKGGPFTASAQEKEIMLQKAEFFLKNKADGIVFGILHEDQTLDEQFTKRMSDLIHRYHGQAVFHKAFDASIDQNKTVRQLIDCHVDRILTSGSRPSSLDGADLIADFNARYGKAVEFQPAGGVNGSNVVEILQKTGCTRFHMSLRSSDESAQQKIEHALDAVRTMKYNRCSRDLSGEDIDMLDNDVYENEMQH